jgi:sugar O-acyltransferase (sialic acid O-acetyltransferase NeuD family)
MTSVFGIYGVGGCGRGIMPLAREQLAAREGARLVFVDDNAAEQDVNGHEVLTLEEFMRIPADGHHIAVAIAAPPARQKVADRCRGAGATFFEVRAGNDVVMDDVHIGNGALISPFVTFTSNIRIGDHFHANLYSYVEHDCVIGEYVTLAPGVRCNGNVHIGDHAYIGAGAIIRQGKPGEPVRIGKGATVGMGAVVIADVPDGATVVGNPARLLQR